MTNHFLKLWLYDTVEEEFASGDPYLDYSGGGQHERINVGDAVWFVTIPRKTENLLLFGRMDVGWVGTREDAAHILKKHPADLWEAQRCIIAHPNRAEVYDLIDISGIADELRFQSSTGRDRLPRTKRSQSLQAMRLLTPASADMLREIWYEGKDVPDSQTPYQIQIEDAYIEGRWKLQNHFRRERNRILVSEAKRHFIQRHGRLYCEVCGFDFNQAYGKLGEDFIEAHHRKPISEVVADEVKTAIYDLAMVCANCHRMMHHRKPWLTVEELRSVIQAQSKYEQH